MEKVELYIISFITKTSLNSVVGSICTVFYLSLSHFYSMFVFVARKKYTKGFIWWWWWCWWCWWCCFLLFLRHFVTQHEVENWYSASFCVCSVNFVVVSLNPLSPYRILLVVDCWFSICCSSYRYVPYVIRFSSPVPNSNVVLTNINVT